MFSTGLGTANIGGLSGSGNIALADLTGGSVLLNVTGAANSSTTYTGILSGIGGLNNAGGSLLLTNPNSNYSGPTTITGGALLIGNTGVLTSVWSNPGLTIPAGATFGVTAGSNAGEFIRATSLPSWAMWLLPPAQTLASWSNRPRPSPTALR